MTDTDIKVSDQLVRLVQVVFGFVLAQSIGRYDEVILKPFSGGNPIQFFALVSVYLTAVLSWIDWHVTMVRRPYNFNHRTGRRFAEECRLFTDLLIVSVYAYMLLSVVRLAGAHPTAEPFLWGYVGVFAGYVLSGLLRRRSYGKVASSPAPILFFGFLYVVLVLIFREVEGTDGVDQDLLNWITLAVGLALMLAYRLARRWLRSHRDGIKATGLTIGLDADGVLANQIVGVLPRIKRRLGVDLTYDDVTDWALPLGTSDIAKEIKSAMEDPDYVLGMPLHDGVKEVLDQLYRSHRLRVLTARPPAAEAWTQAWIDRHALSVDGLASVREKEKSLYATDLLVDDYLGNLEEYLASTNGTAVLMDQPWNQDRAALQAHIDSGRLRVIRSIRELPRIVDDVIAKESAARETPQP